MPKPLIADKNLREITMKAFLKYGTLVVLVVAIPGRGQTPGASTKKDNGAVTKGTKGVVPALLPGIADPSQIHGGDEDALQLKPQEEGEVAGEAVEVKAPAPITPSKPEKAAAKSEVAETKPVKEETETTEPLSPAPREKIERFANSPLPEVPIEPEVAVILSAQRFFPARIRLKEGQNTRLLFTSLNPRPAALVIEQLQVQRWIAGDQKNPAPSRMPAEILREIGNNRMTEVLLQPQRGVYTFHDALSGATGEIVVE